MRALLVGVQLQVGNALTSLEAEATYDATETGADALPLIRHGIYDLLLLNLDLLDMDACRLIQRWRIDKLDNPVLAFTQQTHSREKIRALNAGADDVVTWPIDIEELCTRARAIFHRSRPPIRNSIRLGPLLVDTDAKTASVHDRPVRLTTKELEILQFIAERHGKSVTNDAIYSRLYGDSDGSEPKIVDVLVSRIRRKFEAVGAHGLIRTIFGVGYSLYVLAPAISPESARLPQLQSDTA